MLAYIGPGAGVAVFSSLLVVFAAICAGGLSLLFWPVRSLVRLVRSLRRDGPAKVRRAIVLGMDGLDPVRLRRYMEAGKLPNFARLAREGTLQELGTTFPAVSPVAWATFQTGVNPGKHRIFDFLRREPRDYSIHPADAEVTALRRTGRGGRKSRAIMSLRSRRRSRAFWSVLGDYGVFSTALNVPVTFPPERFYGVCLSGLGVPDLLGSQGTFFYFTTEPAGPNEGDPTGGKRISVERSDGEVQAALPGPPSPAGTDSGPLTVPFRVKLRSDPPLLEIAGQRLALPVGKTTGWVRVKFRAGWATSLRGICRFRLLSTEPHLRLFVSPIHLDPQYPPMPISHPRLYSTYASKVLGDFPTLGFAEDTWALNEGVLDEAAFLEECYEFHEQRSRLFYQALGRQSRGLITAVFDITDRIQHMFMAQEDGRRGGDGQPTEIEKVYVRMDAHVGDMLEEAADGKTALFIISDHGYKRFRRCFNVNGWLREQGYLALKDGKQAGGRYFEDVDWSRTRAYSMGFGALFLNLKGREAEGIVEPAEAPALKKELRQKLEALVDPDTGQKPIVRVYDASRIYRGPYAEEAADLLIGYRDGYRSSWGSVIGEVEDRAFCDNDKAWSGDHCMDPPSTPGVLLSNWHVLDGHCHLADVAPTMLDLFGIRAPHYVDGTAWRFTETEAERRPDAD